ncbi:hypothetical protein LOAG_04344 [Loa loa]|uniref:Tnp_DDE_dom domain-containing protein n=1 Tax=Loa loa TaxID=7209 RepID=A0A1I7VIX4_LOALO|nr:hypothetical protein LOAG_04344 [Loa loa]EFO24142.1 hypothetical protein LOAG_04344 [Loa loa]
MNVNESRKENSLSYLITRNLKCLANTAGKAVEKAIELRKKDLAEGLSYERTMEWLKGQKYDIEKQVIVLDDIITEGNDLKIEWKELSHSANDDDWENNTCVTRRLLIQEDYLIRELRFIVKELHFL